MPKTSYFRVCPEEGYSQIPVLSLDDPRGMGDGQCIIRHDIVAELSELADQIRTSWAYLTEDRDGEQRLLLVTAVTESNRDSTVLVQRARILEEAKTRWLRMTWDKTAILHRAFYPRFPIKDPVWKDLPPFPEILNEAFDGRLITSADHELVQYLLGAE